VSTIAFAIAGSFRGDWSPPPGTQPDDSLAGSNRAAPYASYDVRNPDAGGGFCTRGSSVGAERRGRVGASPVTAI